MIKQHHLRLLDLNVLLACRRCCVLPVDSPGHSAEVKPYSVQGEAAMFMFCERSVPTMCVYVCFFVIIVAYLGNVLVFLPAFCEVFRKFVFVSFLGQR